MKYTSKYAVKWGSNFKLYIFDVTVASDFESDVNQFGGFLHRLAFPVFSTLFFDRFFHLQHIDFTENIYLNKTNCPPDCVVLYESLE